MIQFAFWYIFGGKYNELEDKNNDQELGGAAIQKL